MSVTPPSGSEGSEREGKPAGGESSSISDEEWARFVRESEDGRGSSAPKEPSARARMVTERLRKLDAETAGDELWQPEGWRTGPAWREMDGRAVRRRRVRGVLGVLVGVGVVGVLVLNPANMLSRLPGGLGGQFGGHDASPATPLAPETARPSTAPPDEAANTPTRERPFAGSPAERWAVGAAAIKVPKAKSVGGVPVERMESALRLTKEFLVASHLDRDVLAGARPEKALALIDPLEREELERLRAGLRQPTEENDPKWTFARFDPTEVELVGSEVRVRGRMTVKADDSAPGRALIRADYTFVYPVARAGGGDEVTRAIVRRVVNVEVSDLARYQGTEGRIWLARVDSNLGNDRCEAGDGFIHPQFAADQSARPSASSGEVVDPYDRSREIEGECGTATRL
ncbi:hypothetical protein [Streptomyces apocyni]|uniref:hypothetical protein n=1 Tax=Streptomyces apocyni TaxID=2654677 RepID=UPI0012EA1D6B|nr:hypothetical protein [Streptomyces apocyni]